MQADNTGLPARAGGGADYAAAQDRISALLLAGNSTCAYCNCPS